MRSLQSYDLTESPYNRLSQLADSWTLPSSVVLRDCTLREGEQTAGVNFGITDKLEIARHLSSAGIKLFEGGYVGGGAADEEAIQAIVKADLSATVDVLINAYWPSWANDLRQAQRLGVKSVSVITASSPYFVRDAWRRTYEDLSDDSARAVELAKDLKMSVSLSIADAARSELDVIDMFMQKASSAGVDRISINDSVGVLGPSGVRWLSAWARSRTSARLCLHVHNDLGLAVANCLAGLEAGVEQFDVTVNGLGDRVGIPALDEVATAFLLLYGVNAGIDLEAMYELSRLVARLSGLDLSPMKPLVGDYAFAQKLDDHVRSREGARKTLEALDPSMFGNRSEVLLGRYSGPVSVALKLQEIGLADVEGELLNALVEEVRNLAVAQKRPVEEGQLAELYSRVLAQAVG